MSINKNGIITSYNFSNLAPVHEMQTKILDDGSVWARIYWLDFTNSTDGFGNAEAVVKCLNEKNRYSRMGIVDEFVSTDGIYEFMLTYPSLSNTLYNRWTQTSSPNAATVTGFTAITTAWNAHNYGIRKNGSSTVYNCSTGTTWYAAIGQYSIYQSVGIPAADGSNQKSTELWVRIDNLSQDKMKIYETCLTSNDFIEL